MHYIEDIDTKCDRVMIVSKLPLQHSGIRKLHWHTGHTPLNIQNWLHTATDTFPPSESRKVLNSSSNKGGPGVLGLRSTTRLAPCITIIYRCAI